MISIMTVSFLINVLSNKVIILIIQQQIESGNCTSHFLKLYKCFLFKLINQQPIDSNSIISVSFYDVWPPSSDEVKKDWSIHTKCLRFHGLVLN
jgi:hypothetical protein